MCINQGEMILRRVVTKTETFFVPKSINKKADWSDSYLEQKRWEMSV